VIDLKIIEKQQVYYPLREIVEKLIELDRKLAELDANKADRKGPKCKKTTNK